MGPKGTWHSGEEPTANSGNTRDSGSIPGSGRSSGGGNGDPFQDSCQGNPVDRRTWQGYSPRGSKGLDRTEQLRTAQEDLQRKGNRLSISFQLALKCNQRSLDRREGALWYFRRWDNFLSQKLTPRDPPSCLCLTFVMKWPWKGHMYGDLGWDPGCAKDHCLAGLYPSKARSSPILIIYFMKYIYIWYKMLI